MYVSEIQSDLRLQVWSMTAAESNPPWHRFRDAMSNSVRLLERDEHQEALKLLDESIAEAIQQRQISWIHILCHHAAVISNFMGDLQLEKHYYEQSLASNAENPMALYGLAKIAREQGELEIARQYAERCHKAIVEGDDEIVKAGLLDLVVMHWPELGQK